MSLVKSSPLPYIPLPPPRALTETGARVSERKRKCARACVRACVRARERVRGFYECLHHLNGCAVAEAPHE